MKTIAHPWKFIDPDGRFVKPIYKNKVRQSWWCDIEELNCGCHIKEQYDQSFPSHYIVNPLETERVCLYGRDFNDINLPEWFSLSLMYDFDCLLSNGYKKAWFYGEEFLSKEWHLLILEK